MTFVDGIAASQNIDSSGERIFIAGMDISSLAIDGVFTYEHEAATGPKGEKIVVKMPQQTVGKILKARKIFGESDCEDDRQKYFWQKCQTPYIYIMGELFDDYTDAAKDLAGKFRYDADHKGQNERTVMNFSIEGVYVKVEGMEVTRSVARKCTITVTPCNKVAGAEMVPAKGASSSKSKFDSLFKTESIEIELFKTEPKPFALVMPTNDMRKHADTLGIEPMSKNVTPIRKSFTSGPGAPKSPGKAPAGPAAPKLAGSTNNAGTHIGNTKSGKAVKSHARIHEYSGFSSQDHQDAAHLHHSAAQAAKTPQMGSHHLDKMKLHLQAGKTAELKENRFNRAKNAVKAKSVSRAANPGLFEKSMDAGSGMAAPGQLNQGAALAKEKLSKAGSKNPSLAEVKQKGTFNQKGVHMPSLDNAAGGESVMGSHTRNPSTSGTGSKEMARRHAQSNLKNLRSMPKPNLGKSELLARAEEEYSNWSKREEFRAFMAERMPNLTKGEIDAFGQTLAIKVILEAEEALLKLTKK